MRLDHAPDADLPDARMQATSPSPAPFEPPWQSLPSELADVLAPAVPEIVDRIIETVPNQIPAYTEARDGRYGDALYQGVTVALDQFLTLPGTDSPALSEDARQLVGSLGAGEFRQGRSMDALLAAFRTSARITLRGLSRVCAEQDLDRSVVVDLGESILAYIDELSAVSAQAFAYEQSVRAGALELRRAELVSALVRGEADDAELDRLSAVADWQLPSRLAAVVMPLESAAVARTRLGISGLVLDRESEAMAVVAAPGETYRARLERVFDGTSAVIGPTVDRHGVPYSYRVSRLVTGRVDASRPVFAEDRLAQVILASDPAVLDDLAGRVLEPLQELTETKRTTMEHTLLSWLAHWGQRAPIARELGVHPQTVGYRLNRLRQLFGERLDDPDVRFELELVLRSRQQ